jgi:hypothetical protein
MEATRNHAFFLTSFITIQGRVYQLKSFKDLSTTSPLHDQDQSSQYKLIKETLQHTVLGAIIRERRYSNLSILLLLLPGV